MNYRLELLREAKRNDANELLQQMLQKDTSIMALDQNLKAATMERSSESPLQVRKDAKNKRKSKGRHPNDLENSNEKGSRSAIDTSDKQLRRFQIYNGSNVGIPEGNYYITSEGEHGHSMLAQSIIKKSRKKKSPVRGPNGGVKFEESSHDNTGYESHSALVSPHVAKGNLGKYSSRAVDNDLGNIMSPILGSKGSHAPGHAEAKKLKRDKNSRDLRENKILTIDSHTNDGHSRNRKNFDVNVQSEQDHKINFASSMDLDGQTTDNQ